MLLKYFIILFIVFPVLTFAEFATAVVVDPESPKSELLSSLADSLDKTGIDVRFGTNKDTLVPGRPQLAPLNLFASDANFDFENSKFATLFSRSLEEEAALLAIDSGTGQVINDAPRFEQFWNNHPQEKKIFISFSKQNIDAARSVQSTLINAGYYTFLYLGEDRNGKFTPIDTGNYFREAGYHLVIDTKQARQSKAIAFEAFVARGGWAINRPLYTARPSTIFNTSTPCCVVCYYRNNKQIRCDAPICGHVECANAK